MNLIEKLDTWADNHRSPLLDFLRILLGAFIFYKGTYFMSNANIIADILQPEDREFNSFWVVHYVAMSHLAGGLFLALGLLTRLAAVIQLPILFGAVYFSLLRNIEMTELLQSAVALALLILFTLYGSGRYSADHFFGIGVKN